MVWQCLGETARHPLVCHFGLETGFSFVLFLPVEVYGGVLSPVEGLEAIRLLYGYSARLETVRLTFVFKCT